MTWLDQNRNKLFFGLLSLALAGAGLFYWQQPAQAPIELLPAAESTPTEAAPTETPAPTATPAPVRVYVTGAVVEADVYFLPAGSIVKDAVLAAGGFTAEADLERINQAVEVQDQQQIHVPRLGDDTPLPASLPAPAPTAAPSSGNGAPLPGGKVNLNTASLDELDTLPGIGPAIGQRIIDYRSSIGGFTTVDQVTQVSGIGQATFAKIADRITVD